MSIVESPNRTPFAEINIFGFCEYQNAYECRVALIPEEDGRFSIVATNLPGCVSYGNTIDEAIENFKEAFCVAVEVYLEDEDFGEIPWSKEEDIPEGTTEQRWILIDVEASSS